MKVWLAISMKDSMKWLYIILGAVGGAIAAGFIVLRTSDYFNAVSESLARADVDFDVVLIFGLGFGLFFVPVGIAVGLLVAFLINMAIERNRRKRFAQPDDGMEGGASWVTRRNRAS